jgi:hypothetical protein
MKRAFLVTGSHVVFKFLFFCVALVFLIACNDRGDRGTSFSEISDQSDGELVKNIREIGEELAERVGPFGNDVKKSASEQLEKLFSVEYRIVEFDSDLSRQKLEQQLNILGKDRWDCFNIRSEDMRIRAYCKRLPRGYLPYLIKMGLVMH